MHKLRWSNKIPLKDNQLKELSKNEFKMFFEQLYGRLDKCVVVEGECYETKWVYRFLSLCHNDVSKQFQERFDSYRYIESFYNNYCPNLV